ncbi:hypothetical protein HanRHA438_Chr17g0824481 [Helianthus annuus]|nr:hypothetical protein HanRHA438_Chr17g0824481 [Helianthus annuus]
MNLSLVPSTFYCCFCYEHKLRFGGGAMKLFYQLLCGECSSKHPLTTEWLLVFIPMAISSNFIKKVPSTWVPKKIKFLTDP